MEGKGEKCLIGCTNLSVCWFPVQIWQRAPCVALTSLCSRPVSQKTVIRSDLGMTHHMPAPHTPSDLCLPLQISPRLHRSCVSAPHPPTATHSLSRCSFVLFLSPTAAHFHQLVPHVGFQNSKLLPYEATNHFFLPPTSSIVHGICY